MKLVQQSQKRKQLLFVTFADRFSIIQNLDEIILNILRQRWNFSSCLQQKTKFVQRHQINSCLLFQHINKLSYFSNQILVHIYLVKCRLFDDHIALDERAMLKCVVTNLLLQKSLENAIQHHVIHLERSDCPVALIGKLGPLLRLQQQSSANRLLNVLQLRLLLDGKTLESLRHQVHALELLQR